MVLLLVELIHRPNNEPRQDIIYMPMLINMSTFHIPLGIYRSTECECLIKNFCHFSEEMRLKMHCTTNSPMMGDQLRKNL